MKRIAMLTAALVLGAPAAAQAQTSATPSTQAQPQAQPQAQAPAQTAEQEAVEAIAKVDFLRGVWVGPASGTNPGGGRYAVTQTERIGPLLNGTVMVIEGRGYNPDGTTGFNAFAVISWDSEADRYELRSYTSGYSGTFPFTLTDDGYVWETPAGPGVMRYTAEVTETTLHEVGDFVMPGRPPMRAFEMTLTRRGDSDWPGAGAIQP
jgi:hypothetical protein